MEKFGGSVSSRYEKDEVRQEKAVEYFQRAFDGNADIKLAKREREKSAEEIQIINLADIYSNMLRAKYNLPDLNIPEDNVHIIPEDRWAEGKIDASGLYSIIDQRVYIREPVSRMSFFGVTFHEFVHFKSHNSISLGELGLEDVNPQTGEFVEESPKLDRVQIGISTWGKIIGEHAHEFFSLNEAITEEIVSRNIWRAFEHPVFEKEKKAIKNYVDKYNSALPEGREPLSEKQIFMGEHEPSLADKIMGKLKGETFNRGIYFGNFAYPRERRLLKIITEKLSQRLPEKYKSADEAFEAFEKAIMLGVHESGKLMFAIKDAFGEGTWKRLGLLEDIDSKIEWAESL